MFKVVKYCSEQIEYIQFELSALVDNDGNFYNRSFNCVNRKNSNGGFSYEFIWDNTKWLLNEFYPVLKHAVKDNINLYDLKPEWFDDIDIEKEGELEILKYELFYKDILEMFDLAIKDGLFTEKI
jgi:hypothetical protein